MGINYFKKKWIIHHWQSLGYPGIMKIILRSHRIKRWRLRLRRARAMIQQQMCRSNGAGVDGRVLHRSRGGFWGVTSQQPRFGAAKICKSMVIQPTRTESSLKKKNELGVNWVNPLIVDFPIKTSIYEGFSMVMLNNQRVSEVTLKKMDCSDVLKSQKWGLNHLQKRDFIRS